MEDLLAKADLSENEESLLHNFFVQKWSIDQEQVWKEMLNKWLVSWKHFSSEPGKDDGCSIYSYVEFLRSRMYIDEAISSIPVDSRGKLVLLLKDFDENFFQQTIKTSAILPGDTRMGEWIKYIPKNPGEMLQRDLVSEFRHNKVLSDESDYEDLLH